MLKEILSISGKPGLYKILSHMNRSIIVEALDTKRRMPAYASDRVVSLNDIAIYTDAEEVPLRQIFRDIFSRYEGKTIDLSVLKGREELFEFFAEVLPNFDRARVYDNDIKKIIRWYNLLVSTGYTDFSEPEAKEESVEEKVKA